MRRWYEIWDHVRPDAVAHGEELYEQVHDLLGDAIALRKVGDVPMGVFYLEEWTQCQCGFVQ